MADGTSLTIKCGIDWYRTMTLTRNGSPIAVVEPRADIRFGNTDTSELLLRMDDQGGSPIITQNSPGVMEFLIPESVTATLTPGTYYWDFFGTVAGRRLCLASAQEVTVVAAVTEPEA